MLLPLRDDRTVRKGLQRGSKSIVPMSVSESRRALRNGVLGGPFTGSRSRLCQSPFSLGGWWEKLARPRRSRPPSTSTDADSRIARSSSACPLALQVCSSFPPNVRAFADQITGTCWKFDIIGAAADFTHLIIYLPLIWVVLWFVSTEWLQSLPFFEEVGAALMVTADVSYPVLALNVAEALVSGLLGYESLVAENCMPALQV